MARRDKGSGSITQRPNGSYRMRMYVGKDPLTGRPRYKSKEVQAKNITAARKQLASFVSGQEGTVVGSNATVETLMGEYMKYLETKRRAPRTIAEARRTIDRVIAPVLGQIPINELEGRHIDEMIRKHSGLEVSSVRRYVAVLSAALGFAIRQKWITSSPIAQASLPEAETQGVVLPTKAEVSALIEAMPTEVWKMAIRLAMVTAARRGELCSLKWDALDDEDIWIRGSIYRHAGENHEKSTKSGRERRVPMEPPVAMLVSVWRAWCDARAAVADVTVAPKAYVLSTWPDCSRPLNPDTLSAHVRRATKDLGMDHVHFHSLRHLALTNVLASGVSVRDAAEIAGHADGGRLLLKTYGHPTGAAQRAAAAAMAAALSMPELEESK